MRDYLCICGEHRSEHDENGKCMVSACSCPDFDLDPVAAEYGEDIYER